MNLGRKHNSNGHWLTLLLYIILFETLKTNWYNLCLSCVCVCPNFYYIWIQNKKVFILLVILELLVIRSFPFTYQSLQRLYCSPWNQGLDAYAPYSQCCLKVGLLCLITSPYLRHMRFEKAHHIFLEFHHSKPQLVNTKHHSFPNF